jgi:membrane dipeptidase
MRNIGMLLDVSHMSERSTLEAIDHMGAPVVFTHSNAKQVHDHYRNVSNEQAKACAKSGGLIGVSGSSVYIGPAPNLAEGVFGADHVGLGTDYIVDTEAIARIFAERPDEWPTEDKHPLQDVAYLPPEGVHAVIDQMEKAGYGEESIGNILGGNYLRIAREVWR